MRRTGERVGHEAAFLDRHLLQARPPLCHLLRRETELRTQHQQVVGGTKARMFQHPQGAPATRTPSEKRLGMAMRVCASRVARSQASRMVAISCQRCGGVASMMPAIGPYNRSANRKVGVTGLSASTRASVFFRPCSSSFSTRLCGWLTK
jgi:hypothetical protein